MYLFTDIFQMVELLQRNIANFLAILVGITTAFALNRKWTWHDSKKELGIALFQQYLLYCGAATAGALLRIVLFAFLDYFTALYYLINVVIGIGAAAILDFALYNRYVFRKGFVNEDSI